MQKGLLWASLALLLAYSVGRQYQKNQKDWALCDAFQSQKSLWIRFSGLAQGARGARWEVGGVQFQVQNQAQEFGGKVLLPKRLGRVGERVSGLGKVRCFSEFRNPAFEADWINRWKRPRVYISHLSGVKTESGPVSSALLSAKFSESLKKYPLGVRGLLQAVWRGDSSALGEKVEGFYKKIGLLHVVALSGQHVVILVLLILFCIRVCVSLLAKCSVRPRGFWFYHLKEALPLACSYVLLVVSNGAPSILRTFVMAGVLYCLRRFLLRTSPLQWASSSIALVLAFDPYLVADPGFGLSALATLLLLKVLVVGSQKKILTNMVLVSMAMPILMLPISAFYFARLSVLAPVSGFVLGWVWDFFWIPLGFLLPAWKLIVPGILWDPFIGFVDSIWIRFLQWHEHFVPFVSEFYVPVICPTMGEMAVWVCFLLALFKTIAPRVLRVV